MEIEQLEIFDYLKSCAPLNKLDETTLKALAEDVEISYTPRGSTVLEPGQDNHWLFLIRTGAVERTDNDQGLVARFAQGDFFGHRALERGGRIENRVSALEDSLFYCIPGETYHRLMQSHSAFNAYFSQHKHQRLRSALSELNAQDEGQALANTRVADLMDSGFIRLQPDTPIGDAARAMREKNRTAVLVMTDDDLVGIVTDRAFCTRVVADDIKHDEPISVVMSTRLVTLPTQATVLEAMLVLARHNIRHLPVVEKGTVLGLLTATDLMHHHSRNPIYVVNEVHKAVDINQLQKLSGRLPLTLCKLVEAGLNANDIAYSISSVGRAITRRLLRLAEDQLGPPPVPYAFLVAGSLARNEQTAHSDQDNGLLLDDAYDAAQHGEYFSALARFVSDGLDRCGYIYCPGDVMATNDQWRQPYSTWFGYFHQWINSPEPQALMFASIFFDLRCLHGDEALFKRLQDAVREEIRGNRIFLAYMAANAQQNKPPLGLFRRFVLEKHGAENKSLDMKKRGIMPITDLARVFALDAGVEVINTRDRLQAAFDAGIISDEARRDLLDAYDFLCLVRLRHQAINIRNGAEANNYVEPDALSSLERRHLKDAFELLRVYQEVLNNKYNQGRM